MLSVLALRLGARVTRIMVAGSLWGITLSAGFFLNVLYKCGVPCPDDIAAVTAACVVTGILTIGPLAAFFPSR